MNKHFKTQIRAYLIVILKGVKINQASLKTKKQIILVILVIGFS